VGEGVIITITCECGRKLKANPEDAGMKGRCPDCGKVFNIPMPELGSDAEGEMKRLCAEAAALRREWKQAGNIDKAEAGFREAVEKYGHYWAGHYGLANTLLFQFAQNRQEPDYKKRGEALQGLKNAIKLAATQREPLLELARRTAPIDMKDGERLYQKAIRTPDAEQEPLFPILWQAMHHYKFGIAAAEAGLNALAIDAFCRAVQIDAEHYKTNQPTQLKAKSCWTLAMKKMGVGGV
jgi:tetratricopeptide (TPR) repeat protein